MRKFKSFDTLNDFAKLDYGKCCLIKKVEILSLARKHALSIVLSMRDHHGMSARMAELSKFHIR